MIFRDKTLWGLLSAVLFMMIGVGMIVAVLPQRVIQLDGTGQSAGCLASAFAFSYILFQVPIGRLSDKLGIKPFLIMGYLLCGLTGLIYFLAPNATWLYLARFLQGLGEAPVWALAPALLSVKFPANKGQVIGIYNAVIHLGLTLGPLAGLTIGKLVNEQALFLVYSLFCLAGVCSVVFLVKALPVTEVTHARLFHLKDLLQLLNHRQIRVALSGIALYGAGYGLFLTTLPVFLLQEKTLTAWDIGIFFTLFYAAISLAQLITGPLSDKFGQSLFMITGLLVAASATALVPALSTPLILPALTVASLGMGVFYLASMAYLNEIVPNSLKGTISGAYYLFWGIGMFFGPPVASQIAASAGFQTALLGYCMLAVLIAVRLLTSHIALKNIKQH